MKKSYIINLIYGILWFLPLYYFGRDFFSVEDIKNIYSLDIFNLTKFSIYESFLSTIIAFGIGIIPAYYLAYKDNLISKMLEGLIFIPFFFPVMSTVTVFSIILSQEFLKRYNIMYSLKAIVIANVFYNSPIFIKYISDGLKRVPREVVEAFKLDGANEFQILTHCKLPLILPQIFRAFFMVFTYSFTSMGIVLALGGIKYSIIEVEIANTLMGSLDFSRAFALGILQFILLVVLNSFSYSITEYEISGNSGQMEINIFSKIYTYIYLILQYGIVGIAIIYSFYNFYKNKFEIKAFIEIFSKKFNENYPVIESIGNSLIISFISAVIIVIISFVMIKNYNKFTNGLIFGNLGISGAFLAISLYYLNILYNIPLVVLLIIGNIFIGIPIGYSFMYQYIKKFPKDILEMSQLDCRKKWQKYIYVEIPLLKNILISIFLQIFAIIFGEFTLAYTMQIGDYIPLVSLVNYSLIAEKRFIESSALSTVTIIIIFSLFVLGEYFKRRDEI
ncbi:ABC transporter permease [Cetobacterium sp. SF1]|uniref:ABC transporter permease n=1 Tax=Cetobacterium sp. SF1 TaxID=3417654 RepID=UPI003CED58DB